jgi:hypothetical protein
MSPKEFWGTISGGTWKRPHFFQVPVAHTCNISYSGGRDQEDHSSKPDPANSLQDSVLKKTLHKKGLVEWLKVYALSSSPSTTGEKKKKKTPPTSFPGT